MKSAYELAMERLERQSPSMQLTAEQKAEIADIESSCKARIAERELLLKEQITKAKAAGEGEEVEQLQRQLAMDVKRLTEEAETKKEKVRRASGG
jgi:hypothetical protein